MNFAEILYNIILSPITQIIEISYKIFAKVFNNTGIALIGVSLTVTLLCLPLYIVAEGWQETERKIQEKLKPGIDRIKKAFKGDEQYMILSTFYRQNHYHPMMALRSSFGILIQIPFFLAAYHTLSHLPELQHQSFLFIKDMGSPDSVFKIGTFSVNILPIAMTLINCISGTIYSKGHSIREKIQIYGMAMLFLVVLYGSPAGLVVYWTMNNIFSLVKNVFYKMRNPVKVLYYCMCAAVVFMAIYILFCYHGGANLKKRGIAVFALLLLVFIPYYLKLINYAIAKPLSSLAGNSKDRFTLYLLSALSLCILNGLVLPSSMIASSVQEFSNIESYTNPTAFLHSSFWMSFGLIVFWPTCVYFLFKEKIQTLLSFCFSFLISSSVINAYVFSGNYGSMDATLKFIDGFSNPSKLFMLADTFVAILLFISLLVLLNFRKSKLISTIYSIALAAFIIFSFINAGKINRDYKTFARTQSQEDSTEEGFVPKFHLSKSKKNVVVFMLDRFESSYLLEILDDEPSIKDKLEGFTFYPNTVSFNGHTLMASPSIYGGYEYSPYEMNKRPEKKLKDKHNEALLVLPELFTKQADFNVTLSDLSWANYSYIADMSFAKNLPSVQVYSLMGRYSGDFKKEKLKDSSSKSSLAHVLNRNLFWVSLFRESLAPLRSIIYYKGTWWENGVAESSNSFADWFSALYYLPKITDFTSDKGTLSIITNETTHSSEDISMYDISFEGKNTRQGDNAYLIDKTVLSSVTDFIDYLKNNDAFDNTKIIIVSDHGIGFNGKLFENQEPCLPNNYMKDHLNPVLLVKDFKSNKSFNVDFDFMTNADVPNIALSDIIDNPINPFTGNIIDDNYKKNGVVVTKDDLFMPYHSRSDSVFTVSEDSWYTVKDNIFKKENWNKLTE